ncbi:PadR family transcriptional regulator [Aeromicrobium alkaliterrae]|uniref:Transcription regulator PadR N-terminal domain-containing protein n=1 Tax=Aeromicrobium alkaliterrae TaxID=302168 RepID=A0ABP4WCH0_9ACTN
MNKRRTQARVAIATTMLATPDAQLWGYELSKNSRVGPGSMYPFLSELLEAGYLTDGWDTNRETGERTRRYYRLTDHGKAYLSSFVSAAPAASRARAAATSARPKLANP